jgi:hypothetical protein
MVGRKEFIGRLDEALHLSVADSEPLLAEVVPHLACDEPLSCPFERGPDGEAARHQLGIHPGDQQVSLAVPIGPQRIDRPITASKIGTLIDHDPLGHVPQQAVADRAGRVTLVVELHPAGRPQASAAPCSGSNIKCCMAYSCCTGTSHADQETSPTVGYVAQVETGGRVLARITYPRDEHRRDERLLRELASTHAGELSIDALMSNRCSAVLRSDH